VDRKRIETTAVITLGLIVILLFASGTHVSQFNRVEAKDQTSPLGDIGDKIEGLDFNAGVFDGNIETCDDSSTCVGTSNDDIIRGGNTEQVYGRGGDDMIFGGLSNQLYGGGQDDIILAGAGSNVLDGDSGDDLLMGSLGNDLLTGGSGNDKLFAGGGDTIMKGGEGANHFDCPISLMGLARAIVLDYNPDKGDTIAGVCKVVNTVIGDNTGEENIPEIDLPN
jgi:Ca2+-binding RTX toxin-like protein